MCLDRRLLSELQDVMEEEFEELLHTYIDDSGMRLGLLAKAIAEREADQARHHAHSVKGSSSNIGATELAEKLKAMELNAVQADWPFLDAMLPEVIADHRHVCETLTATFLQS